MPISQIYFLDLKGRPLLSRTWRDDLGVGRGLEAAESFISNLKEAKNQVLFRSGIAAKTARDLTGTQDDSLSCFVPPVMVWKGVTHIYQRHNNIFILLLSVDDELDCLSYLVFIEKLIILFESYFGSLEEEAIRDNFVVIYQLLDEVIDHGYPQQTEPSILKEYIQAPSSGIMSFLGGERKIDVAADAADAYDVAAANASSFPSSCTDANSYQRNRQQRLSVNSSSKITWRREGIQYPINQVFLDVVERINVVITAVAMKPVGGGSTKTTTSRSSYQQPIAISLVNGEIHGTLRMKSLLSGMPELRLGLNDKSIFCGLFGDNDSGGGGGGGNTSTVSTTTTSSSTSTKVGLDDVKFHQCVRLAKFEDDRSISFCPPDGDFDLMTYTQKIEPGTQPLIWVVPRITRWSSSLFEISLEMHNSLPANVIANGVEVHVPTPKDCDTPRFKCDVGFGKYCPERNCFIWTVGLLTSGKGFSMRASFGLSSVKDGDDDCDGGGGGANGACNSSASSQHHLDSNGSNLKRLGAISLVFEVPYHSTSGLIVKFLKIQESAGYVAQPWVRYISESGDYHIRGAEAD